MHKFTKDYETVLFMKLWEILQESSINYILIKVLKNLYEASRIKHNNS